MYILTSPLHDIFIIIEIRILKISGDTWKSVEISQVITI